MPWVYTNPYREPWLAAQQELVQRELERQRIMERIEALRATIKALEPLATTDDLPPAYDSLPQLCCDVLMHADRPLKPLEVRDRLGLMGIRIHGSNPMAILHTTLHRLTEKPGSNVVRRTDQGNAAFEWTGVRPTEPVDSSPAPLGPVRRKVGERRNKATEESPQPDLNTSVQEKK